MRLKAPAGGCTIRLYRHGLGDCFLLAFAGANRQQKYVLIDCGVLLGTSDANTIMQAVAADIEAATGGHLHALVITHEHWDHISGFQQAQDVFANLRVDKVWFAWTEDPDDALAGTLRGRRRQALQALQLAAQRPGAAASAQGEQINYLLNFFGEALAAGGRATTEDILDGIKTRWPEHLYCTPGMAPLTLSGLPDVRFFVLGPPREKKYINKSRPSSRDSEVYLGAAVIAQALALSNAADPGATDSWQPFHPAYRVAYDDPDIAAIRQRYNDDQLIWRQIGQSWLPAAGELALDLDSHTNNTSLVLAIELSPGGKVLLFPGDAQVGNWLSWHEVQWPEADAGLTAADLLGRTVFYKVGHHGSHNATLQGRGLELMTSPELAAFVPVELAMAEKRSWSMPYPPLYERLNELTAGRVALTDARQPVITEQLPADFAAQLREEKLYVDVTIHGRSKPG